MTFLNLIGAAFFVTLPVILGLYILRLKRKQVTVSTTLFWRQVMEDVEANTPFQRLRYSHLLLLQLLIAALLVLALMQPTIVFPATAGLDTVLVVDTSPSMATADGNPTRIDSVKLQLTALIEDKGARDRLGIVTAGQSAKVLSDITADKGQLLGALEQLTLEPAGGSMAEAADLAIQMVAKAKEADLPPGTRAPSAIADPEAEPKAQTVFFTDDPPAITELPDSTVPMEWSIQPVGFSDTTNAAILTAAFTNPDTENGFMSLFLTTFFKGEHDVEAKLTVHQGTRLLDLRTLTLTAGKEESHVFDGVPLEAGRYHLQLELTREVETGERPVDGLATDNEAWLVYEPQEAFKILVLSSNGVYGLILKNIPDTQVFQIQPSGGIPSGDYDLIVMDGDLPLNAPPGNYLVIHSNNHELLPVEITGEADFPVMSDWKATDPLLRFVNPQAFTIASMMETTPKDWGRVVLDTTLGPAIVYGESGRNRIAYWAFDPFVGDFWTKRTFPILLAAHIDFFKSRRAQQSLTSNDLIQIASGAGAIDVERPDGQHLSLTGEPGEELAMIPDQLGFWRVTIETPSGPLVQDFGVSLFSPGESDLPGGDLFSGTTGFQVFEQSRKSSYPQWRWFALGLLIFLMAEWWIYHQRIF